MSERMRMCNRRRPICPALCIPYALTSICILLVITDRPAALSIIDQLRHLLMGCAPAFRLSRFGLSRYSDCPHGESRTEREKTSDRHVVQAIRKQMRGHATPLHHEVDRHYEESSEP